jgi:hypothetical protein
MRLEYSCHWVCLYNKITAATAFVFLRTESLAVVANLFATALVRAYPDELNLRNVTVRPCDLDAEILEGYFACFGPLLEAVPCERRSPLIRMFAT